MTEVDVRIAEPAYRLLHAHLFPGDRDEHAAVLLCGVSQSPRGTRLLVREVILAEDGADFVSSDIAYKKLTTKFIMRWISKAAKEQLCYLAVHNHRGKDSVAFSRDDLASHVSGYPALLDIAGEGPVGALVFAENAVAGDIWFPDGRAEVSTLTVIGPRMTTLRPQPHRQRENYDPEKFDRSMRLFGDEGQQVLAGLRVTIIGVGGGGSLVNEWLSRLGIGSITAIDPDNIERSNLPRVVDSTEEDVKRNLPKVAIAQRVALKANPQVDYTAIQGDVGIESVAKLASDSDVLILAGDNFASRNVFNALVQQYLIPGFHIGVDIQPHADQKNIANIKVESRVVMPWSGGGCLRCEGLIPADKLQLEGLTPEQRKGQGYFGALAVDPVPDPSVMTLNVLSAGGVANDIMMMFTALYDDSVELLSLRNMPLERRWFRVSHTGTGPCRFCKAIPNSLYARGDRAQLPCRQGTFEYIRPDLPEDQ